MALRASNENNLGSSSLVPWSKSSKSKKTIEQTFTKLTQLEHVLLRPDTYIGSVERVRQDTWVWDDITSRIQKKEIIYSPGLYKIFDEILVNAADHKQRDPSMDAIKVEIDTENQLLSVWNNGAGIPVEFHQKENVYVPELIFGNLLTSSNYDDNEKKIVGGRNGFGAKLANIFSTEFVVETADSVRGKRYKQVFRNNMSSKDDPIIKSNPRNESFTKITFSPDLERFGMTYLDNDIVSILKKRVYDVAGINSSLKVHLNGTKIPIKTFKDYVAMYTQQEVMSPVMHERVNDRWEVAITASDGQLSQVSFVNSIWTVKGGTHVTHVADQIVARIAEHIARKNKGMKVKPFQIKNHLSLFINCLVENPSFDSQTKETLTTKSTKFGSKWTFSDDLAKKVMKSGIVENVLAFARFKQSKELAKTDGGKKARVLGIPKLDDANKAGSREASKCTLILTEGDSAKALAISGLSVVGRDYYGVFPLRGKLLNVREAKHKQIMDNAEINNLKKILGLQHNKTYDEDSIKSLRYGHVLIMADQDHDGSHIKGLVINFFDHFWPSLLQIPGFLQEFITPIVKCVKGKNDKVFFTMPEYKRWITSSEAEGTGWKAKYYKGLGTSTAAEAKNYFSNLPKHLHEFQYSGNQDSDMIELAFSKQRVDDRKQWLSSFTPGTFFDHGADELNYSNFVNKELILFSVADNARSIPSVVDGLKPSQRKVLFACFKRKLTRSEIKVAQLAGYVAEHAAYHHGEMSLQATIVGLAQNFIGSNNVNLLVPAGQFGTRLQGGKDAASSRYIFTKLAPITRALFPEVDDPVLKYLEEDGLSIEPEWYCPVIPMVLVNGSDGIGTGWSSSLPCYNPHDLIESVRSLLAGKPIEPIRPWYRGFQGSIVEVENSKSFDVYGMLKSGSEPNTFKIDELPIRSWTTPYKEFLESNIIGNSDAKEPFVKDFQDNSTENKVSFTFTTTGEISTGLMTPAAYKKLKLVGTLTTSNMVLFDSEGRIRKYNTPEEIVQEFFKTRFALYEKRRAYLLEELEKELMCLDNKQRFILLVINGELKVAKRKKAELLAELKRLEFDPILKKKEKVTTVDAAVENEEEEETDSSSTNATTETLERGYDYLLSMPLWSLTAEKVAQLGVQRDKKATAKERMEATTPRELWETDLSALEDALVRDEADTEAMIEDLERVAQEARARQRKGGKGKRGKTAKSYAIEDNADEMDFEAVALPEVRTVVARQPKARKIAAQKTITRTNASNKGTGKTRKKPLLEVDEFSEEDCDEHFSEYSEDEELIDLVESVTLDEGSFRSRRPGAKKAIQSSKTTNKMIGDGEDLVDAPSRRATRNMASKKTTSKAGNTRRIKEIVNIDDSEEEGKGTESTKQKSAFDFDEESGEENGSLTLSQRLAERHVLVESAPKASQKSSKTTSVAKKTTRKKSVTAGPAKRARESKTKTTTKETVNISPSPSPQSKKTRVKSPKANKVSVHSKEVTQNEGDSVDEALEAIEVTLRPRRQQNAIKRMVISESEDASDDDDDFVVDDDSDYAE